ncbi:hypothetical protein [Methylocapsa palsarum]|uniref:hypothetical protein n=1 Tax=Methylocapsa palsarum TaxID=1612308 RepID=UPI001113D92B|nr:hypothetical protein [Methylocapsa palsarum]
MKQPYFPAPEQNDRIAPAHAINRTAVYQIGGPGADRRKTTHSSRSEAVTHASVWKPILPGNNPLGEVHVSRIAAETHQNPDSQNSLESCPKFSRIRNFGRLFRE